MAEKTATNDGPEILTRRAVGRAIAFRTRFVASSFIKVLQLVHSFCLQIHATMRDSRRAAFVLYLSATMLNRALAFTALSRPTRRFSSSLPRLFVATTRDADPIEQIVGGERYEMVPLPDSMLSTTIFVGNLCEFVTDDILSLLFSSVSKMISVPACVARKPNMSSLQYGFVTFPTVQEKEVSEMILCMFWCQFTCFSLTQIR